MSNLILPSLTDSQIKTAYEINADTNEFDDTEQTKLAGIESGATADQTNGEIKTAYEANANTNEFSDAEQSKLSGIESGATADQTNGEIKTAYEANANTNEFSDAEQTKLTGIESGATADQTKADVDALGVVAASIIGQGALATLGSVGASQITDGTVRFSNEMDKNGAFSTNSIAASAAETLAAGVWILGMTGGTNVYVEIQIASGTWKRLSPTFDANNAQIAISDGTNVRVKNNNASAITVYQCKMFD